ncbi:MAG: EAL and HDOD domain-containing protein [Halanaerobiales bacterium]
MMGIYITRKPILNPEKEIIEYETLTHVSEDYNSDELQELTVRLKNATPEKKIYVNIQDDLFKRGLIKVFPDKQIGISILENPGSINKILFICRELKSKGFPIMLGDFALDTDPDEYLDTVDIVKINLSSPLSVRKRIRLSKLKESDIKLIATGVNSNREFTRAISDSIKLLQGDFYYKIDLIKRKYIPTQKLHYFNILREINQPDPDFDKIETIIKHDISLSYNLFRLVNSAYFGLRNEVRTIKQALILLGLNDYKKWLTLKIMRGISEDKPNILIINSLIRANFCENLAPLIGGKDRKLDYFLIGLFSLIDAFLGRSIASIIEELPLAEDTRKAIIKKEGTMGEVFKLVLAYEKGQWQDLINYAEKYNLKDKDITECYFRSVEATNQVINALA